MDHLKATTIHAAERYLLNELSPEDREAFEAHYFDCRQCAEDVRTVFVFKENAQAVFAGDRAMAAAPQSQSSPGWFDRLRAAMAPSGWLSPAYALAAVILLGINGYQWQAGQMLRADLDELNTAHAPASVTLRPAARNGTETINIGRDERFVILEFEAPAGGACEVRNASGVVTHRTTVRAPQPGHLANIVLPASQLPTGRYEVIMRGQPDSANTQPGAEIARYPFTLQRN